MHSRTVNNIRNNDDTSSDQKRSEKSELNSELDANLDDLIDPRLQKYLLARGYTREGVGDDADEEIDEKYGDDSEWNPSEDVGYQYSDEEDDNIIFYISVGS